MADVVAANYSLILVMPRLGIPLGFGERSVQEVCAQYGLPSDFVLLVFNVYTFNDYLPDEHTFENIDLHLLVPYLLASHRYYLNERLPHIERHLMHVAAHAGDRYGVILKQFFADYKQEVQSHFQCEEEAVFPVIQLAERGQPVATSCEPVGDSPRSHHFADNHSDLVDCLSDLTQIVYKYLPGDCMVEELNELVFGIMQMSDDLEKHALLEEKILLPYLARLEQGGQHIGKGGGAL